MGKLVGLLGVLFLAIGLSATESEPQGIGGCYEAKPICISGKPVCMCTVTQDCHWACR